MFPDDTVHRWLTARRTDVTVRPASALAVLNLDIRLPMHDQLHAPVQNAASERTIYPEEPSSTLTASIAQRRMSLIEPPATMPEAPVRDTYVRQLTLHAKRDPEVSLR